LKVYIPVMNSIAKSNILNIKIRPLVTEYALIIKLMDGTSSAHSFNPYAYFGHSWSYFDIQNLQLVILYLFFQRSLWVHQHFLANHKSNPRVNFNCWIYGQKVWALSSCSDTPFWNSFTMKNWLVVFMESKHIEKQPAPT
jgi:hypothetical protein